MLGRVTRSVGLVTCFGGVTSLHVKAVWWGNPPNGVIKWLCQSPPKHMPEQNLPKRWWNWQCWQQFNRRIGYSGWSIKLKFCLKKWHWNKNQLHWNKWSYLRTNLQRGQTETTECQGIDSRKHWTVIEIESIELLLKFRILYYFGCYFGYF